MFNTKLFVAAIAAFAIPAMASPVENATLAVRADDVTHTGRGTWFHPGLGACGQTNNDNDPVVAIGIGRFGSGGNCNQWMKITNTATGATAFGQTLDACESCGDSDIDMSPSLFQKLAPLSQGVITVSWNFEPVGFQPPK
ncbi:Non-catalytic module family EXPN protein [Schizopora paradoxa]|uniref:Non-catalytic module family EXPN protein n=1 Tax=Schizopora paradoxa TaxID=27342 RepID=A0A0H2RPW0_9AGAM|nr:Non-catalytic module family EXPN protein [Schizopora paradoxa]